MGDVDRTARLDALESVYAKVTAAVDGLDEPDLMRPSLCAGWTVGDVLYHLLLDARRALLTFASPSTEPVDVDDVSYWRSFSPDGAESVADAHYVRIAASAYPPGALACDWRETAGAAVRGARACAYERVTTQGRVLSTTDFVGTLVVEAAVHYLDMTAMLTSAPEPDPVSLGLVRHVLDGLLACPVPIGWDDRTYALKGTGRVPLDDDERAVLGPLADRIPLFE